MRKFSKYILCIILFLGFVFGNLGFSDATSAEEKKQLEDELKQLEEQIASYEKDISKTAQEKKNLQNQISVLKQKISKLNLQINQSSLTIKDLKYQISDTEDSIKQTTIKIDESKEKLAVLLQSFYEEEQRSMIEVLLSSEKISDFFDNLVSLEFLNSETQDLLVNIKNLQGDLNEQKSSLEEDKSDVEKMMQIQVLQKRENENAKKEKDVFLQQTEAQYQKTLQEKQKVEKRAAEIKARIFDLAGISKAPTFGEALEIAKYAESITGIRPAFLLAVLTQESNLGKNVGQCYLKDSADGSGIISYNGKAVSRVMKPSRDVSPFLEITKALGRDPYSTPVSCPMSFGWGGAMGPAQFIPSTWVLYGDKVQNITGRPSDPWNIKDAFLAAAFYLTNYGAANQSYNSEWKAAMIYFSGSTNTKYRFYGDSVMNIASQYQQDIKSIE